MSTQRPESGVSRPDQFRGMSNEHAERLLQQSVRRAYQEQQARKSTGMTINKSRRASIRSWFASPNLGKIGR